MNMYERNLQALSEHHPELVALMRKKVETRHIVVKTAHSGAARLLVTSQTGEQVFIHNEDDPLSRAAETASNLEWEKEGLLVLLGFGLGYLGLELAKRLGPGHALLICETDPAIFRTALHHTDLTPLLHSERIKILIGDEIPIGEWVSAFNVNFLVSKISLIKYHPCYRLAPALYARLEHETTSRARALKINAATMMAFGPLTLRNLCRNVPWVRRFPGVSRLTNRFQGRPAIVAAAGPSLDQNLALLKEVKGKALLIAVDTLLGLLLPHEIPPDIVVTLDPQERNCEKFRHVMHDTRVSLVCHPVSPPEILRTYPGSKFTTGVWYPLYQHLARFWEDKGYVGVTAQSVVHVAFDLAKLLGADPIIFVGLDLSFPRPKFHAGNLLEEHVTLEQYRHQLTTTTDIFGDPVDTISSFQSCQHILEKQIQDTEALCIDATEGGVRLEGTHVMRLRDAIDEFCQVEPMDIAGTLQQVAAVRPENDIDPLLTELKRINRNVRLMLRTSGKILRCVRVLEKMQRHGQTADPRYTRFSATVEQATNCLKEQGDILDLLPHHAYQLELYMSRQDTVDIDAMAAGEARFKRQLERAKVYYDGLREILKPFVQETESLLHQLEAEQRLDAACAKREHRASLPLALEYKGLGYYDRAMPLLQQCLNTDPRDSEALYHLAAIYAEQGQYGDALKLLETAQQVQPESPDLQTLHARCQQKMADWQARCGQARHTVSPPPQKDPAKSLLEAGNFYFKVRHLERARKAYQTALKADPELAEAHYLLAHVAFTEGDDTAGVAALEETLKLDPQHVGSYRDLGLIACRQGLYRQAEQFILKAMEITPEDAGLYELLGQIHTRNHDWMQAAQVYETLRHLYPERPDILETLAVLYQKQIAASVL